MLRFTLRDVAPRFATRLPFIAMARMMRCHVGARLLPFHAAILFDADYFSCCFTRHASLRV